MPGSRREFLKSAGAFAAVPFVPGCSGIDIEHDPAVPQSGFGPDATAEDVTRGMDLSGQIAVVTGCNSGIGYETMRVLALRGAHVLGTGRTMEKAQAACASVIGRTSPVELELTDFDSIVRCAETIRSLNSPIDMLILNAGMNGGEYEVVNGVEKHFAVNHLGHFLLANRIMDRLYFADQGRVVVVSSRVAYEKAPQEGILFDDLEMTYDWDVGRAYAHSKLANALFSYELARLLRGTRITSNALHPGVIATNIARDRPAFVRKGFELLTKVAGKSVEEGAATSVYVATHPSLGNISGRFFLDCNAVTVAGPNHLTNREMASRLWVASEGLVGGLYRTYDSPEWSDFEQGVRGDRSPDAQPVENRR